MLLALSSVSRWLGGQRVSTQFFKSPFLPSAKNPVIPPATRPAPPTPSATYASVLFFLAGLSTGGAVVWAGPTARALAAGGGGVATALGSFSSLTEISCEPPPARVTVV